MRQDLLYKTSYRVNPTAVTGAVLSLSTSWDYYFVSGGTTITGIGTPGVGVGMQVCLEFLTETTIAHSATLLCPLDQDISALVGDVYRFVKTSPTAWRCVHAGGFGGGGAISNAVYGASWDGVTTIGASKNSIYDEMQLKADAGTNADITEMKGFTTGQLSVLLGNGVIFDGQEAISKTVGIGVDVGKGLHTTVSSVVIGWEACGAITEGDQDCIDSVVIGAEASNIGETMFSVIIGKNSGNGTAAFGDMTLRDECVYIGANILSDEEAADNEIIIGANAVGNGDFTTTIGTEANTETHLHGVINLETTGQILFPGTANPSSDVNALDDYEEGVFTPGVTFGGGDTGIFYSDQEGYYTKIGRIVHFTVEIRLSSKGTSTGLCEVTGLPFTASADVYGTCAIFCEEITYSLPIICYLPPNTSTVRIGDVPSAGPVSRFSDTDFENNTKIKLRGHYYVD